MQLLEISMHRTIANLDCEGAFRQMMPTPADISLLKLTTSCLWMGHYNCIVANSQAKMLSLY